MITIEEASKSFLDYQESRLEKGEISERTFDSVQTRTSNLLDLVGGDTPVQNIDPDEVQNELSQNYSDRTVKDYMRTVSRLQNYPTRDQVQSTLEQTRSDLEAALDQIDTFMKKHESSTNSNSGN